MDASLIEGFLCSDISFFFLACGCLFLVSVVLALLVGTRRQGAQRPTVCTRPAYHSVRLCRPKSARTRKRDEEP